MGMRWSSGKGSKSSSCRRNLGKRRACPAASFPDKNASHLLDSLHMPSVDVTHPTPIGQPSGYQGERSGQPTQCSFYQQMIMSTGRRHP
jgi:hypothetical protein